MEDKPVERLGNLVPGDNFCFSCCLQHSCWLMDSIRADPYICSHVGDDPVEYVDEDTTCAGEYQKDGQQMASCRDHTDGPDVDWDFNLRIMSEEEERRLVRSSSEEVVRTHGEDGRWEIGEKVDNSGDDSSNIASPTRLQTMKSRRNASSVRSSRRPGSMAANMYSSSNGDPFKSTQNSFDDSSTRTADELAFISQRSNFRPALQEFNHLSNSFDMNMNSLTYTGPFLDTNHCLDESYTCLADEFTYVSQHSTSRTAVQDVPQLWNNFDMNVYSSSHEGPAQDTLHCLDDASNRTAVELALISNCSNTRTVTRDFPQLSNIFDMSGLVHNLHNEDNNTNESVWTSPSRNPSSTVNRKNVFDMTGLASNLPNSSRSNNAFDLTSLANNLPNSFRGNKTFDLTGLAHNLPNTD